MNLKKGPYKQSFRTKHWYLDSQKNDNECPHIAIATRHIRSIWQLGIADIIYQATY